jgi:excisionase family DNA binding protein
MLPATMMEPSMKGRRGIAYGVQRGMGWRIAEILFDRLHRLYKLLNLQDERKMPAKSASKEVYTVGEMAALLNVAENTVRTWFETRQITGWKLPGPHKKSFRHRRITKRSLLEFLQKNEMAIPESLQVDCGGT